MKGTRALLAAALIAAGIGPALSQNITQNTPQNTTNNTGAPANRTPATNPETVGSGSTATQNPYVNPSAAGTQLGRTNQTAPTGPSVAQPAFALQQSDKTPYSADQARKLIEAQGYSSVSGLRREQGSIWQAMAMHGGRQVHVGLDAFGHVAELR